MNCNLETKNSQLNKVLVLNLQEIHVVSRKFSKHFEVNALEYSENLEDMFYIYW